MPPASHGSCSGVRDASRMPPMIGDVKPSPHACRRSAGATARLRNGQAAAHDSGPRPDARRRQ